RPAAKAHSAARRPRIPMKRGLNNGNGATESRVYSPKTLRIQGIVNDEFPIEDFMITQPKAAKAVCNPSQRLAGGVRITRVRISGSNNFGEQFHSRIAHFVFFQNGVERYVLPMVTELA